RKNRKMFIFVSTDGSASSANDDNAPENTNWVGDNPTRSMGYILAYNPAGAPPTAGFSSGSYQDAGFQLNHFDADYSVSNDNPMGALNANTLYASAVFLNYLNFAGIPQVIDKPELAAVKKALQDASPVNDIFAYYTRIKG
ncbi:MAG: hypothetical protein KDD33_09075, partial [Bdellovibrionales bacterium]|nr:hypothetical protein [Bdellovibrionales bacterium]